MLALAPVVHQRLQVPSGDLHSHTSSSDGSSTRPIVPSARCVRHVQTVSMNDTGPEAIKLASLSRQPVDQVVFNEFGVRPVISNP